MKAIEHAINTVMNSDIPIQILEDTFIDKRARRLGRRMSVDQGIRDKVILNKVRPDLSAIGGMAVVVDLVSTPYTYVDAWSREYTIPPSITDGRQIVSINRVGMRRTAVYDAPNVSRTGSYKAENPYNKAIHDVVDSHSSLPQISNSDVEVVTGNVIRVRDNYAFSYDLEAEILLELSEDLKEIKPAYYQDLGQLTLSATKAHIYRTLALQLDKTKLESGRDFSRYKEFIDGWSDAWQIYQDQLNEKWYKILVLNDPYRKRKHIQSAGRTKT